MIDTFCTRSHFVNSGVRPTGPNLTKFLHNVAKSLPFNLLKSKLWSSNPFRNVTVPNEGGVGQFLKLGHEIVVAMATSLEQLQSE